MLESKRPLLNWKVVISVVSANDSFWPKADVRSSSSNHAPALPAAKFVTSGVTLQTVAVNR
jgi:hypothetical protein